MPISKPHSSFGGNNKGSCNKLADYLDKENQELERKSINADTREKQIFYKKRQQQFFTHTKDHISKVEVISSIDNNKKRLSKKDDKFFAPTINFSKKELQHIAYKATRIKDISDTKTMSAEQFTKFNNELKKYGREVMNNYAKNFNRKERGINSGNDLVYFGKIEHNRKYRGTDKDVIDGKAKAGQEKPGFQSHIHIIVSRKDKSQQTKLSPVSNEKKTKRIIGKNNYTVGFHRKNWTIQNEKTFDRVFGYNRFLSEKFHTQNLLKNGSPKEIEIIRNKIKIEEKYLKELDRNKDLKLEF